MTRRDALSLPAGSAPALRLARAAGAAFKVRNVELPGVKGKLQWSREAQGLIVRMPERPCDHAIALKVAI
jgi:hypothetical protein